MGTCASYMGGRSGAHAPQEHASGLSMLRTQDLCPKRTFNLSWQIPLHLPSETYFRAQTYEAGPGAAQAPDRCPKRTFDPLTRQIPSQWTAKAYFRT